MIRCRASSISTDSGMIRSRASISAAHSETLIVRVPACTKCSPLPAPTFAVICGSWRWSLSSLPMTVKWKRGLMAVLSPSSGSPQVLGWTPTRPGARCNSRLAAVRGRPFHLPAGLSFDDRLALLEALLAPPHPEPDLGQPVHEVDLHRNQGQPLLRGHADEPVDLLAVQQ